MCIGWVSPLSGGCLITNETMYDRDFLSYCDDDTLRLLNLYVFRYMEEWGYDYPKIGARPDKVVTWFDRQRYGIMKGLRRIYARYIQVGPQKNIL